MSVKKSGSRWHRNPSPWPLVASAGPRGDTNKRRTTSRNREAKLMSEREHVRSQSVFVVPPVAGCSRETRRRTDPRQEPL